MGNDAISILQIGNVRGCRQTRNSHEMREALNQYVNSDEGSLSWQLDGLKMLSVFLHYMHLF